MPEVHRIARLAGILDPNLLATAASAEMGSDFPEHLICVTLLESPRQLVVRATRGSRGTAVDGLQIPVGAGIGGLAVARRQPVSVADYAAEPVASEFVDVMVGEEGVRGAAAVPLCRSGVPLGVVFAGRRAPGRLTGVELARLRRGASMLTPLLAASLQARRQVELAVTQERERIASELHDSVLQTLFGIGASARRARERLAGAPEERAGDERSDPPGAEADLRSIETLASTAGSSLRAALRLLAPVPSEQELPLRVRAITSQAAGPGGEPPELLVLGSPLPVTEEAADVLAAVAREALSNAGKHAPGAAALVTLAYGPEDVTLAVQDDGPGLDPDFELRPITAPDTGDHFGLASLNHRLTLLGGSLRVGGNEDGGVTVKAALPLERCAS